MKLLNMTKHVYDYYRENVRGNENTSYSQIQRKLTRNMLLAYKEDNTGYDDGRQLYKYGSLWMLVVDNKVVWIRNKSYDPTLKDKWKLDKKRYVEISKELGIEDADTYGDKVKKDIKYFVKRKVNKMKRALNINKTKVEVQWYEWNEVHTWKIKILTDQNIYQQEVIDTLIKTQENIMDNISKILNMIEVLSSPEFHKQINKQNEVEEVIEKIKFIREYIGK